MFRSWFKEGKKEGIIKRKERKRKGKEWRKRRGKLLCKWDTYYLKEACD